MIESHGYTMKVYLVLRPDKHHTLYDELINYPPRGVNYRFPPRKPHLHLRLFDHIPSEKIKSGIRTIVTKTRSVYTRSIFQGNVDADLIHICDTFAPMDRPWVMDLELASSLTGYDTKALRLSRKHIEKAFSSEKCKKIMPWTNAGRITLENFLNISKFRDKIEVVYPSIHPISKNQKYKMTEKRSKIRLLFVGSVNNPQDFVWKGGEYAIKCFEILSRKYDVELVIRSKVPNDIKKKYHGLENLIFLEDTLPKDGLYSLYAESNIALLPGHVYPLMATLESMAFGLPIVTIDGFANSEFVKHGETGFLVSPSRYVPKVVYDPHGMTPATATEGSAHEIFLREAKTVDPRVVNDLAKYCSILIEDKSLRRKMGKRGRRRVERGDLSIKVRNQKLRRIYEEAVGV